MNNTEKLKELLIESNDMVKGMASIFINSLGNDTLEVDNLSEYQDMCNRHGRLHLDTMELLSTLQTASERASDHIRHSNIGQKVIYKYPVSHETFLPIGAEILKIAVQYNVLSCWAKVDRSVTETEIRLHAFHSGVPLPDNHDDLEYVDTFQLNNGERIIHVFSK